METPTVDVVSTVLDALLDSGADLGDLQLTWVVSVLEGE